MGGSLILDTLRHQLSAVNVYHQDMNGLLYDVLTSPLEHFVLRRFRRQICAPLKGLVVDVGVGIGADFEFYDPQARVTALEPDSRMLARAARRRSLSRAAIYLVRADDSYLDDLSAG
ncbi:MAG: hypothetical protein M3160_10515 [Candidatus Eremiobacteraeota bacterium]|nr:hypothetical protein [Candidatus Eremiobacteraeota bacterium]